MKLLLSLAERGIMDRKGFPESYDTRSLLGFLREVKSGAPEVTAPVALHVAAKRYLCAVEPGYLDDLSPSSARSLALQGGPMSPAEVRAFERLAHHEAATLVRRWDDRAKVAGLAVADLDAYQLPETGTYTVLASDDSGDETGGAEPVAELRHGGSRVLLLCPGTVRRDEDLVTGLGASISEFPVTLEAAQEAQRRGMHTIMGAPNTLRGASHSGNLSATDAIEAGAVPALRGYSEVRAEVRSAYALARFVEEIKTIGRLEHPNIIPIHDVGVDEHLRVEMGAHRVRVEISGADQQARKRRARTQRLRHQRRCNGVWGSVPATTGAMRCR